MMDAIHVLKRRKRRRRERKSLLRLSVIHSSTFSKTLKRLMRRL